ncbi:MAG: class F sortase [Acidobacteria bacterium]|nr:class F sortase [Acidobacteriota bacterium]
MLAGVALAAALALTGCTTAAPDTHPAKPVPTVSPTAQPAVAKAAGFQDPASDGAPATTATRPVRIVIPAIGVDAGLIDLARDAQGVLQAPPSTVLDKAGWYAKGTVPGQIGPAVIAGHVDWVKQVAVFHRLGELTAGDAITVVMNDGSTVHFTVDDVRTVSKFAFPTASVYGPTPDPQLRVITCGGPWDDARNIYSDNVVVSAAEAG